MRPIGIRVVRGPDWVLGPKDGGEHHLGTVIEIISKDSVTVCWDCGSRTICRIGQDGKHDVLVFDTGPIGIVHPGVICSGCKESRLSGIRWSCTTCFNVNLCTPCYHDDEHDLSHPFSRIDFPHASQVVVPERCKCRRQKMYGFFPRARVRRYDKSEETDPIFGEIQDIANYGKDNCTRDAVIVRWQNDRTGVCQFCADGHTEMVCVEPTTGADYYKEHLSTLDIDAIEAWLKESLTFNVGDRVCVDVDQQEIKELLPSGPDINEQLDKILTTVGSVMSVFVEELLVRFDDKEFQLKVKSVRKVFSFKVGDTVRVYGEKGKVERLMEHGSGGWTSLMENSCGNIGQVHALISRYQVLVAFHTQAWAFNTACLYPAFDEKALELTVKAQADVHERLLHLSAMAQLESERLVGAILKNDISTARTALKIDPSLKDKVINGLTPLHYAAHEGATEIADLLLDGGADINAIGRNGVTPLIVALAKIKEKTALRLIERGADIHIGESNEATALHFAVIRNLGEATKRLLAAGSDINKQDKEGDPPIHEAIDKRAPIALDILLADSKLNLRLKNSKEMSAIHMACIKGFTYAVDKILTVEPTLAAYGASNDMMPIHIATINNHGDCVRLLLSKGKAHVDVKNRMGMTALHGAAMEGYFDLVKVLTKHGAKPNVIDQKGNSPLHLCMVGTRFKDNLIGVKFPMSLSEETKRIQIAQHLIDCGGDVNIANNTGVTVLSLCSSERMKLSLTVYAKEKNVQIASSVPTEPELLCIECGHKTAEVRFLPCEHRVTCFNCAVGYTSCPLCSTKVREKVDKDGKDISELCKAQ